MTYMYFSAAAICAGFILDLLLGDPQGWPHFVRLLGAFITKLETVLNNRTNKRRAGTALVLTVCTVSALIPAAVLCFAYFISPWVYFTIETLLIWQCIAAKSLRVESGKVYKALKTGDLPAARYNLSMIVGRDTELLDTAGVTRAAVETVAENISDGVIAPMFYIALFGAVGGCLYKAINTMDSMIGYKNARYIDFGRFAARLDDAANYIPARLSALLLIISAAICKYSAKNALRIWRRDRRKHASPNSAQTESAAAGALGIRLAGDAYYKGILHEKPCIGDDTRPIEAEDIRRSHRLLYAAAVLMFVISAAVRGAMLAAI